MTRLAAVGIAGPRKVETPAEDVLIPWSDQIQELLTGRGCEVSYTSLRRFVRRREWSRRRPVTVRMGESEPGEVAEMDFSRLGMVHDPETGRRRVVWGTDRRAGLLAAQFVWPTFSQKLVDVIDGLEAAWGFYGGVPKYLVIDNFPAAVAGTDPCIRR